MFHKKSSLSPYELPLVGLNELRSLDRWSLENRARALTHTITLGDGVMLGRILGRYKMYVPTSDAGFGVHVMMEGVWEGWLTVLVTRLVQPGMTVVDVGANHGYYTVLLADLVGETGRVVALEPHPGTAELLKKTLFINGFDSRVELVQAAAVAKEGADLHFFADPTEPKNARVVDESHAGRNGVTTVRAATLDALLTSNERIDFMKIDVEGAEEAAMAGAMGVIERDRPDILLEFNSLRCADPAGLLDRLEAIYGDLLVITYESTFEKAVRADLLDPSRTEDWSLFLTVRKDDPLFAAIAR